MYIYVPYSRPNGWTDWAEIFVDTHGWPGVKKFETFFKKFCPRTTPGPLASDK